MQPGKHGQYGCIGTFCRDAAISALYLNKGTPSGVSGKEGRSVKVRFCLHHPIDPGAGLMGADRGEKDCSVVTK